MTTNENPAAVRVCAIDDIQCSRGCGTGACKREQPAAAPIDDAMLRNAHTLEQIAKMVDRVFSGDVVRDLWGIAQQLRTLAAREAQPAPSPADERAAPELLPIDRKWVTAKAVSLVAEYRNCKASETEEVMQRFVDYMQASLQDAAARAGASS
ncbi:TPA: hypothetical protein QDB07_003584 [Burkholderia vietnamiensis]|nr:hypothetical protein [Burkholderia vietnamiensis]